MLTHEVSIYGIRNRNSRRKAKRQGTKPYELRWKVGVSVKTKSFVTSALADQFRADLLTAARRGEQFDTATGLPESMLMVDEDTTRTWLEFAKAYVTMRWPDAAANTRESIVQSLAVATPAFVDGEARNLERKVVRVAAAWALVPREEGVSPPPEIATAVRILSKCTLRMTELTEPDVVRQLLTELGVNLDGRRAAPDTLSIRRRAVNTALEYAVERRDLDENPLQRKEYKRKAAPKDAAIDRRVVANPDQARELLTAVSYVGSWKRARGRRLVAFFATLYYAGLRPAEATGLRHDDCQLPDEGWGTLHLQKTRPVSGKQWTDNGTLHDERGLKQRQNGDVRPVPVPPSLVAILKAHIDEFGVADDGRLFSNERGGLLGMTTVRNVFREARQLAFAPHQVSSPLVRKPYDLRHAALSTWLNGGVDPTDVAERAGNSVEVLLKTYAKSLDGREERNNRLIELALGESAASLVEPTRPTTAPQLPHNQRATEVQNDAQ